MSIVLQGSTSGSITLQEPAIAGTTVLDLPATSGNVVVDSATQTLTNKTLTSPTLTTPNINSAQFATVSGTAPIYPCRAWVNFDGTGTVAIRASGNVSSITDNNTGRYTVNFTTSLPDANYSATTSANISTTSTDERFSSPNNLLTTSVGIATHARDGNHGDSALICVAVFR
jgi:hypothetical protein